MSISWSKILCVTAAAFLSGLATADQGVMIESRDGDGKVGRVLISGDMARIETRGDDGLYLLVDLADGRTFAVNDEGGFTMDMNSPPPARQQHGELDLDLFETPDIRLEAIEDGPLIAGIQTTRYRITVDDTHCYDEYLSAAALENTGIRRFTEAIAASPGDQEQRVLIQMMAPGRICEAVGDLIDKHYPSLGVPMRTLNARGEITHEVTRIAVAESLAPELFELPAGYPLLTRQQVINRMRDGQEEDDAILQERQRNIERQMREHEPGFKSSAPDIGDI